VQWAAENVDHNLQTLYEAGTIHRMGITSVLTPLTDSLLSDSTGDAPIQRLKRVKVASLISNDCIPVVVYWSTEKSALASCVRKPVTQL
jgi:hypothetical protein